MNRDTGTFHSNTLLRPILSVCILLMLIIAAAGVAAAAMPPVPYFSQCDSRWGSDRLGGDGPTICSMGCALTSAAMVMAYYGVDTDPKRLNNAIGRGGYDGTYCIKWSAVRDACHDEINQIEYSPGTVKPFDTTVLNNQLDARHPVIVNVDGHFVVVTGRSDGTYYINDPISSAKSTLDAYPNRVGMHIYSGNPPDINKPLVGDWNGNGTDTTGIYNYTTAEFSLDSGLNISFGISGDIPITGDWNGDGYDTIGVFRPSTAQFFLDYDNDGVSDMNATFGVIGDIPVAGDWDGDGDDNIGVFRQNHSDTGLTMFFLDFDNSGDADLSVAFGEPDDLPVIGDWDGDGDDNIGLYRTGSTTGVFYLDIDNDGGAADIVTPEYGDLGDIPIAGDWDGDSDDNIGVYRPETGEFFMDATVPEVLPSKTIYVDDDFSDEPSEHKWDTIQEGVDDATDGDTVIVYAGVYVENVDVSKRISLIGEGAHDLDEGGNTMIIDDVGFMTSDDSGDQYGLFVRQAVGSIPALDIEFPDPTIMNKEITITVTSDGSPIEGAAVKFAGENLGLTDSDGKVRVTVEDTGTFTITATKEGYESASEDIRILTDEVVTVWAADVWDHVFDVTADYANISGFTVTGATYGYGIQLINANHCSISDNVASNSAIAICLEDSSNNMLANNTASNNEYGIRLEYSCDNALINNTLSNEYYGIYFAYSSNNTLANNTASNNSHDGIAIMHSSNYNALESNTASDNSVGIELFSSRNNTLANNTASNNDYNGMYCSHNNTLTNNIFIDDGLLVEKSCRNTVENNVVNGKPLVYLEDASDSVIQNAGQVILVNCTNITVENLNLSNTSVGVELCGTGDCRIMNNIVSNNGFGIILLYGSNNNTIDGNTASKNELGVYLSSSTNNTFHHNNLINNTPSTAYDDSTNTWDSGSEGNHYGGDYTGTDSDGDGIGDTPHPIPGGGGSIDRFPLMQPWTPPLPQNGDLNGDDRITSADAAIALTIAAGGGSASCDPATFAAADVSGDGRVTSLDALMILQAAAGATEL